MNTKPYDMFTEEGQAEYAADWQDSVAQNILEIILNRYESRQHYRSYLRLVSDQLMECCKEEKPIPFLLAWAIAEQATRSADAEDAANIVIDSETKRAEQKKKNADEKKTKTIDTKLNWVIGVERRKVVDAIAGPLGRNTVEKQNDDTPKISAWEIGFAIDAILHQGNKNIPEKKAIEIACIKKGIHESDARAQWLEYKKYWRDTLKALEKELGIFEPTNEKLSFAERRDALKKFAPPPNIE